MNVEAYIGLGANLGDRSAAIARAVAALDDLPGVTVRAVSRVRETDPVGPGPQPPYLNAGVAVVTTLEPGALLAACLAIEVDLGRRRTEEERWGPRTIDLDLLLYDARAVDEPGLRIPHPRLAERRFVLEPLAELSPDLVHPTLGRTIGELLAAGNFTQPASLPARIETQRPAGPGRKDEER
jgi:2-amino-4-hydroxy-6-hydroxymethyldihydropteridine diphosphokinase